MKKILALVLALMLVFSLSACSSKEKTLKDIQKKGSITIATSPDFPPFEDLDGTNVVGIDIDVWNAICEKIGVKLDIQQIAFDSIIPGVQAGKIDVGASGISINEDRKKNVLFTAPYCMAAQAIVVPTGSPITCKADLAGKSVSVQSGTTAETFCMGEGYNVGSYESNSDAQMALTTGKVDAWVIDDLTAAEMTAIYNAENPDTPLIVLPEAMTSEPYAYALAFGSEPLVEELDKVIKGLVADGTIEAIFAKYGVPYFAPEI